MNIEQIINANTIARYAGFPTAKPNIDGLRLKVANDLSRLKATGKLTDTADQAADTLADAIGVQVARQLNMTTAKSEEIAPAQELEIGQKMLDDQNRNFRKGWL